MIDWLTEGCFYTSKRFPRQQPLTALRRKRAVKIDLLNWSPSFLPVKERGNC